MGRPALKKCPECGQNSWVRNTYTLSSGTVVRVHWCECGNEFRSEERPPDSDPVEVQGWMSPGMRALIAEALVLSGLE